MSYTGGSSDILREIKVGSSNRCLSRGLHHICFMLSPWEKPWEAPVARPSLPVFPLCPLHSPHSELCSMWDNYPTPRCPSAGLAPRCPARSHVWHPPALGSCRPSHQRLAPTLASTAGWVRVR